MATDQGVSTHSNPSPGTQRTASRSFQVLDCARLLAVLSIVWLHTPESPTLAKSVDIGRFAVPFFTFAAMFLAFQSALRQPENSLASYAKSRFNRIYLVFVAWAIIYAGVRVISSLALRSPFPPLPLHDFLWDGTAHHLWFLPFIFLASTLSFAVAKWTAGLRAGYWMVVALCVLSGLAIALTHSPNTFRILGYTWELSVDTSPSVLLGIAFAMTYVRISPGFFSRKIVVIAGVALWLGCLAFLLMQGRTIFLETLSGLGLMIASLNRSDSPPIARFAKWGKFAFGIYILHILFLEGFQNITPKLGWGPSWQNDVTTFFVTLFCSAVAIFLLNKNARTRKLLL